ncbi:serum paraoxonase/arylesterase 2-like isoform X3 [Patiria miniata]|uniref:Paraoxonase n=1 Tax=Patiria miniata TaxID=46514 RepID=A0A913Z1U0_PATMI|nr:serum paraoxonase/arylesterase 2-like isoform X3 [Patiria miniata]
MAVVRGMTRVRSQSPPHCLSLNSQQKCFFTMFRNILIGISAALILQHILSVIYSLGFHKRAYNHRPGSCRVVTGIDSGSEDIHVLRNGLALITSGIDLTPLGHLMDPSGLTWKGRIYLFDFKQPNANVTELPILGSFDHSDFRPHGISVWEEETQTTVFVVNHKQHREAIEVLSLNQDNKSLQYLYSITDPLMRSVNDVVAVGSNSFYFTNDGYNNQLFKRFLERFLKFPWGNVIYYDGDAGRGQVVVSRGLEPNGINRSPDGRYIYVSSPIVGTVTVYEQQADHALQPIQVIDLSTSPDNIYVDSTSGDLWLGCHMIGYQSMLHFQNFTQPAASQAFSPVMLMPVAYYKSILFRQCQCKTCNV